MKKIWMHFVKDLTCRKAVAIVLGNIIAGIGIALLRFSLMGNDPYSAMNMALSGGFGMGLGTFQLIMNLLLIVIQLIFGREYIGLGSIVNMCFLGYIVQFSDYGIQRLLGSMAGCGMPERIVVMLLSLALLACGLAMYQAAALGAAPFDYLSLGLSKWTKRPYFIFRVLTDAGCILVILVAVGFSLFPLRESHIGVGTVACAFCLGPMVNAFMKLHRRWVIKGKQDDITSN